MAPFYHVCKPPIPITIMLKVSSLLDMVQSDRKDGKGAPKTKKMKKH